MFAQDYEWYIRHLTEHVGMKPSDVEFVDNIASWCRQHGVDERDEHKPLKLVIANGNGARMLIAKQIPDQVLDQRVNETRIRSQLKSLSSDRADLLNSATKKLAYLFLKELSLSNPRLVYDDLAADDWIFEQMHRIGMFNP